MSQQAVYAAPAVGGYEHRAIRLGEGSVVVRLTMKDETDCFIRGARLPPDASRPA